MGHGYRMWQYYSLSRQREDKPHKVKIDKSFVFGIHEREGAKSATIDGVPSPVLAWL